MISWIRVILIGPVDYNVAVAVGVAMHRVKQCVSVAEIERRAVDISMENGYLTKSCALASKCVYFVYPRVGVDMSMCVHFRVCA